MLSFPTPVADLALMHARRQPGRAEGLAGPDDLLLWFQRRLGVRFPARACCPEHTAPADALIEAFFAAAPVIVWHASRGFGGKSFLLAALALAEAVALGAEVRVLGGSSAQSENVVRYTEGWTGRAAIAALLADRLNSTREAGVTRSRLRLQGGGMVDALAASSRAVRGPHPQRLRIDEADELDLRLLDAALGQPMSRPEVMAQTVISSTHHYYDGTMTEVLRRAAERGWPVRQWCYKCTTRSVGNPDGWLSEQEVEEKRQYVTPSMWRAEYDLQVPVPEGGGQLKREWFRVVGEAPAELDAVARSWDEAATAGGGDWTTGALMGLKDGVWYVMDMVRAQVTPRGVDSLMDQCAATDGWEVPIILQQEPGSSGKARVDQHRARLSGYDVQAAPPTGRKDRRVSVLASAAEAENVRLVRGEWVGAFLDECEMFPAGHDDQVDAVSWAMIQMAAVRGGTRPAPTAPGVMGGGLRLRDEIGTRHRAPREGRWG